MSAPKSKKEAKPSLFLYSLGWVLTFILAHLLFRIRVTRRIKPREIKGPVILLGNHQSFIDPLLAAIAFRGRRLRFVAGEFLFQKPFLNWLFTRLCIIPKKQFTADPAAVLAMMRALKAGDALLLYPEGQRSLDGGPLPLQKGMLRMAEKTGADILTIKQYGGYCAWPRWAKGIFRPGKIELVLEHFCTAEDIREQGTEVMEARLAEALGVVESDWQKSRRRPARYLSREPARNLHLFLHRCPSCELAGSMEAENHAVYCTACGARYPIGSDLFFKQTPGARTPFFEDIRAWHLWQTAKEKELFEEAVQEGRVFWQGKARLEEIGGEQLKADGEVRVDEAGLYFRDEDGRDLIHMPFKERQLCMYYAGVYIQIVKEDRTFRIFPEEKELTTRYADLLLAKLL